MSDEVTYLMKWIPSPTTIAAWIAIIISYLSYRRSGRALRLAEQQEERRRPVLVLYLQRGYLRRTEQDRIYKFLLSISNPSDSNNAVARIDLRIEYRTAANFRAAVDVPAVRQDDQTFGGDNHAEIEIPIKVDAHNTVTGWVCFQVKKALLKDCNVDSYVILVTDSHGERGSIETALVQEFVYEAEIKTS